MCYVAEEVNDNDGEQKTNPGHPDQRPTHHRTDKTVGEKQIRVSFEPSSFYSNPPHGLTGNLSPVFPSATYLFTIDFASLVLCLFYPVPAGLADQTQSETCDLPVLDEEIKIVGPPVFEQTNPFSSPRQGINLLPDN